MFAKSDFLFPVKNRTNLITISALLLTFLAFRMTGGAVSTRLHQTASTTEEDSQRGTELSHVGAKSILGIEEEDFPQSIKGSGKPASAHAAKKDDGPAEDFDPLFFGNSVDTPSEVKRPLKKSKKGAATDDHARGGLDDIERQLGLR